MHRCRRNDAFFFFFCLLKFRYILFFGELGHLAQCHEGVCVCVLVAPDPGGEKERWLLEGTFVVFR